MTVADKNKESKNRPAEPSGKKPDLGRSPGVTEDPSSGGSVEAKGAKKKKADRPVDDKSPKGVSPSGAGEAAGLSEERRRSWASLGGLLSFKKLKGRLSDYFNADAGPESEIRTVDKLYAGDDAGLARTKGLAIDPLARTGIFVVLFGLGGFILWSFLAPIGSGVIASGVVSVDSLRKSVQHLEGGIVSAIYVKEGDLVEEGDVLIELDRTKSRAERNLLQTRYYSEVGNLNRLEAERRGDEEIAFSDELIRVVEREPVVVSEGGPEGKPVVVSDRGTEDDIDPAVVGGIVEVQRTLFVSKRELQLGEKEILGARLEQINRQVAGLQRQLSSKEREVSLIEQELEKMRTLAGENIVDLSRILGRERELAQANGEIGRISADIASAEVQAGEARLRILQIDREIRREASESILETQEKIFDLNERMVAVDNVLDRTQIKAPQTGYVIDQKVATVGGVIAPGTPIMEIVPLEDTLIIDAKIQSTDIDNVEVGKEAEIRLVAFQQRGLPAFYGEVEQISADAVVDPELQIAYYRAKITLPEEELGKHGLSVVPGMPAEVLIKGRSRSAFSYFTEPFTAFLFRGLKEE